ncbi:FHA domain-containing serine/threonine-protein kinase [Bacteroides sp. 519]|uniref:FHA domain-containing serine/threonine-protein kinase n=1 Tax=Bacteroides sp. 519 TaxID=2302937 RepID=UPI0013CF5224|nr:FHA domain-containing serine/threonine-protein kinase [Bacteroides sp. 519]NDV57874.1 FHA domain-containing protein [Bacteroides sp. 519]
MTGYIPCERCDFRIGDCINQHYTILKQLGEGTFGKVFQVKNSSGQIYALKLLKLWTVESHERNKLMKRFDMEFEAGQIQSNYLVHSHEKGIVQGNPYIVMEYCPGGDLLTAAETRKLNFEAVASQVLFGLRDLHNCGKVHRDLKPENVLIRQNGTAVLTDFGIAGDQNKRMTERGILGTPKQIFGTYGYMPPEQINPRRGDATVLPTTDIFSFGVMFYQMLTYEMPFGSLSSERDLPTYVENGKKGKWDRTLLANSHTGKHWMGMMEGCLEPDFKKRLQNVDQVLALLPKSTNESYKYQSISSGEKPNMQVRNGILLKVMQGEEFGKIYKLNELLSGQRRIITLGREDRMTPNAISIKEDESSYISRKHCTLEYDSAKAVWLIRDGQWEKTLSTGWKLSLNGTYVNSTEVTTNGFYISPGDIISVGDVKLRVEGY